MSFLHENKETNRLLFFAIILCLILNTPYPSYILVIDTLDIDTLDIDTFDLLFGDFNNSGLMR